MQSSQIDTLLQGSTIEGRSSLQLKWGGLIIERRTAAQQNDCREDVIEHHHMLLWCKHPTTAERAYKPGKFTRLIKQPGTVSLGPAGVLPAVRSISRYDVVAAIIHPAAIERITAESDLAGSFVLHEHLGTEDAALATLLWLAAKEVEDEGVSGRLYADSLCQTIISRFMAVSRREQRPCNCNHPLPKHALRRVLERIETDFDQDLSLADLAAESGYSRAHFLRMFRAATGKTPHRQLQEVRLNHARQLILEGTRSFTQIAFAAGFSRS
jgi:AraC family transcriptional regulator